MKWITKQLGRKGFPLAKKLCIAILSALLITTAYMAGMGTVALHNWSNKSTCDRLSIEDFSGKHSYKKPGALSDKELVCLITESSWPAKEWERLFKQIYCESSKVPFAYKEAGGVYHRGLLMMSDLNTDIVGLVNGRENYIPEVALEAGYKLYKKRKWQPWETDPNNVPCLAHGPNMDGDVTRDGWDWAQPIFDKYFLTGFDRLVAAVF